MGNLLLEVAFRALGLFAVAVLRLATVVPTVGEEGVHGEVNVAEQLAGVLLTTFLFATLPGGCAVVTGADGDLAVPLQTNGGELTHGDVESLRSRHGQGLPETLRNGCGNVYHIRFATAVIPIAPQFGR